MASGISLRLAYPSEVRRLNSCSGDVWPRGPSYSPARRRSKSLNSCSGEVWPRGDRDLATQDVRVRVSILVLVKYGLGAPRRAAPRRADDDVFVSILVLVKYGLGV